MAWTLHTCPQHRPLIQRSAPFFVKSKSLRKTRGAVVSGAAAATAVASPSGSGVSVAELIFRKRGGRGGGGGGRAPGLSRLGTRHLRHKTPATRRTLHGNILPILQKPCHTETKVFTEQHLFRPFSPQQNKAPIVNPIALSCPKVGPESKGIAGRKIGPKAPKAEFRPAERFSASRRFVRPAKSARFRRI